MTQPSNLNRPSDLHSELFNPNSLLKQQPPALIKVTRGDGPLLGEVDPDEHKPKLQLGLLGQIERAKERRNPEFRAKLRELMAERGELHPLDLVAELREVLEETDLTPDLVSTCNAGLISLINLLLGMPMHPSVGGSAGAAAAAGGPLFASVSQLAHSQYAQSVSGGGGPSDASSPRLPVASATGGFIPLGDGDSPSSSDAGGAHPNGSGSTASEDDEALEHSTGTNLQRYLLTPV